MGFDLMSFMLGAAAGVITTGGGLVGLALAIGKARQQQKRGQA